MKQIYYVNVKGEEITKTNRDLMKTYFKVKVDQEEYYELSRLLKWKARHDYERQVILKPFSENDRQRKREEYNIYLRQLYQKIFDLATPDTKMKMKEMNIFDVKK